MSDNLDLVRSAIGGMVWPAIPDDAGALALALQFQLSQSQWWSAEQLAQHQLTQAALVLRHAYEQVPYYRVRLADAGYRPDAALTAETFARLPILSRSDVQSAGESLRAQRLPGGHGGVAAGETSGSTGKPVVFYSSALEQIFWNAFTLRDHIWHRREFSGKLAAIRLHVPEAERNAWGGATSVVVSTGPFASLNVTSDINYQLDWLERQNPEYLLSLPSNLDELARRALERNIRLPRLREVRTVGETLVPRTRALVRDAWGVRTTDIYSAQEAGYIALQCPEHEHYHVQSEGAIVEIVADDGTPCRPGEIGQVVLTPLHNFAMPLVRYQIGDLAEAGAPCDCGRGLPVIRQIYGRVRNMLTYPDGRKSWPSFGTIRKSAGGKIRQHQCIQRSLERIDVLLAVSDPLTPGEESSLRTALRQSLGYPFELNLVYCDGIARSASGKFEEFRSEL